MSELSEAAVADAYRFFLGREPESDAVIQSHLTTLASFEDLRQRMLTSAEFREKIDSLWATGSTGGVPLDAPRLNVEIDADPETLARMIRRVEETWAAFGYSQPHWSVLTDDKFKPELIGENAEEFYETGVAASANFLAALDRAGQSAEDLGTGFELGCGVGRLTVWLAKLFRRFIAADISEPHIRIAAAAAREKGFDNIDFRVLNTISKLGELPAFDAFISIIVLQHNPPPIIALLLRVILRKLNPGGFAYFQVPTYRKGAHFDASAYLAHAASPGAMEMHVIPQADVLAIAEAAGCRLLDVREDNWAGPAYVSNSFLLQKRGL